MADILVTHLPNVRYLTGFSGSSGCVLLGKRRKLFFTDFRYKDQAAREVSDFDVRILKVALVPGFCSYIRSRRMKFESLGIENRHISHADYLLLRRQLKGTKLRDATGIIENKRRIKSRREVERIRRASAIADEALRRLRRHKLTGRSERQVAWLLESFMREAGSGPMPFETIVASGPRSAMPHGIASDRIIRKNELVVIDFGASVDGYCCDMTRTFATGRLSTRQKLIYETVRRAQQLALEAAKQGMACAALDRVARDHIAGVGYGDAFGHSLGHGVGLEAHESPLLAQKSEDTLVAGMVVTIEPGIYIGRSGVRIEDTVLVTKSGASRMTEHPRDMIVVR